MATHSHHAHHAAHSHLAPAPTTISAETHPEDAKKLARKKFATIIVCLVVFAAMRAVLSRYYEPLATYLDIADHAALIADVAFMFSE